MQEKITVMKKSVEKIRNRAKSIKLIFILVLLLVVSMFCVLKFSKILVWSFLPEVLKKAFLCPAINTNVYEVWLFINNICFAYITSFLFYLLVEYIPAKTKEKKAMTIISDKLIIIYKEMSYFIRAVLYEINVQKDIKEISIEDLKSVETLSFDSYTKYANIIQTINGTRNSRALSYALLDKLQKCIEEINRTIDEIFSMQIASNIGDDLVETLSEIRQSGFLNRISLFNLGNTRTIPGYKSVILGLDIYFFEMIQCRERLKNYKFPLFDYIFEKMSDEQISIEREKLIYFLERSFFMYSSVERIQASLSYMPNIILDDSKFYKLNGVLMEALVTYDIDNKQYGYLLPIAKNIAEFLCDYEGSQECRDLACLNYLQVLRRIGTYPKKFFKVAGEILSDTNRAKVYRIEAAIILKNFDGAKKLFNDLDESQQKQLTCSTIYRLWDNPPIPATMKQPDFRILS